MPEQDKFLIIVGGPTASGKTGLAIKLAALFETEIVSADSRQLYKELNIGVARPDPEELASVNHHFIASHSIDQPLNAGTFAAEARKTIDDLFTKHNVVVVVGGTGLYIKALLEGFDPLPPANETLRADLKRLYEQKGISALQELYYKNSQGRDPVSEINNPQRLIRALEIAQADVDQDTENPLQEFRTSFEVIKWAIDMDRDALYQRINTRVDQMMASGLEQEARSLLRFRDRVPLRTVGYTEMFRYFEGDLTREEAIEKIRQHSRNYAKRQLTWFRKDSNFNWVPAQLTEDQIKMLLPRPLSHLCRR